LGVDGVSPPSLAKARSDGTGMTMNLTQSRQRQQSREKRGGWATVPVPVADRAMPTSGAGTGSASMTTRRGKRTTWNRESSERRMKNLSWQGRKRRCLPLVSCAAAPWFSSDQDFKGANGTSGEESGGGGGTNSWNGSAA